MNIRTEQIHRNNIRRRYSQILEEIVRGIHNTDSTVKHIHLYNDSLEDRYLGMLYWMTLIVTFCYGNQSALVSTHQRQAAHCNMAHWLLRSAEACRNDNMKKRIVHCISIQLLKLSCNIIQLVKSRCNRLHPTKNRCNRILR